MIATIKKEFIVYRNGFFLALSVFVFSLLRIPSLIEPHWYGDEGVYEVIGRAIWAGKLLYVQIWDNKPPLLYMIYALFNGDQFSVRLFSLCVGALSVIVLYLLAKKIFKNIYGVYAATFIFAVLFGLPLLEGNIANAENFMILPILVSFFLLVGDDKPKKIISYIYAGILLSIAFLIKIVAIFDCAALFFLIIAFQFYRKSPFSFLKRKQNISFKNVFNGAKNEIVFGIAFCVPIFISFLFFFSHGALKAYLSAAFFQNVGYVGYGNTFIIPQGLLYLKMFFLLVWLGLLYYFRKRIGFSGIIIGAWGGFSVFNAFFSGRPYTHYILVFLPAFSLLVGYLFEKRVRGITILLIVSSIILIYKNFDIYRHIGAYYQNYAQFSFGKKSITAYEDFFDKNTSRNDQIAQYINAHTSASDSIFIWGDGPQLYVITNKNPISKYTVAYHILWDKKGIADITKAIANTSPKYIIDTKGGREIYTITGGYQKVFSVKNADIYERSNE